MSWENGLPKWTTNIFVNGPIEVDNKISFRSRKDIEFGDTLYSNVKVSKSREGVKLSVNSFAPDIEFGKKAALIFSGLALDVLSVKTKCPLYVSIHEQRSRYIFSEYEILRTVTEDEWKFAFQEARLLTLTEPTFLRALGWYRKGQNSDDPFDKFLAFWNSIEVVAGKYHIPNKRTKQGIKNQIWQCFIDLWGECENWKIITGQIKWIDENYENRKNVAHGIISIDVASIEEITNKLNVIEKLANIFLVEWRNKKLNPQNQITEEIKGRLDERDWIKIE
jgi:hypothetical protein